MKTYPQERKNACLNYADTFGEETHGELQIKS